ncbi:MAG: hypothetical protein KIT43_02775 [Bauldia sp.]|nr:hypothetical protein [Bauldia sp.]MCW5719230.1 hypothetical protein [Bauldia sp.]
MMRTQPKAAKAVAGIHYYVVPTLKDGRRLVAGTPQEVADETAARNRIATMPGSAIGLAAYEVELNAEGDTVSEPSLIAAAGRVPGVEVERATEDA